MSAYWTFFLLILPAAGVAADSYAGIRSRGITRPPGAQRTGDFRVLVPIWGSMTYLTSAAALAVYGGHVTLCTTGDETPEFYQAMNAAAAEHGFATFTDTPAAGGPQRARKARMTGGTVRDRLIRNALTTVTETYVIPLDADSTPSGDLGLLAGELAARRLDVASVRLVPANPGESALTRLQQFEYRVAMQTRFLVPWLLSGACHVARTAALTDVMARHSLYMQGNDVETGVIAGARGYRVGHIPFEVATDVPARLRPWLRQRLAWAGGQFRLFIVNIGCARRHPFMWFYGAAVTYTAVALRWELTATWRTAAVAAAYLALVLWLYLRRGHGSWWVLAMPAYVIVLSFIIAPLGAAWYVKMSLESGSWGIIRPGRRTPVAEAR